jgi:large subunit ribosomal protein L21
LDRVLLIADGDNITVGTPFIEGAKVLATSKGEVKDDKIIVFKYKPKVRYRKKTGHRQIHTRLSIDSFLLPGSIKPKATKKTKKVKTEVKENGS